MPEQEIPEPCSACGGFYREDCSGGFISAPGGALRRCPEWEARRAERRLAAAQIPELYRGLTFDDFRVDLPRGARQLVGNRDACRSYVERFQLAGEERTVRGLLLVGPNGTGKTSLLAAVLREIIRRTRARGLFADFTLTCAALQATFDDPSTSEARVMQPLLEAEILALDDLGARRPTPYVMDTLYLIINTRYNARLPTLFSTNHPLEAPVGGSRPAAGLDRPIGPAGRQAAVEAEFEPLLSRVGPRIYSRLFELTEQPALSFDQAGDYRRLLSRP